MSEEVLFLHQGDHYLPTELAGSPWHPAMLHGGAPAALLAHCLQQSVANSALQPSRLTIDLMRPVPKAPLAVSIRTIRNGKRIVLQEATLSSGGVAVAMATGLFVQAGAVTVPDYAPVQSSTLPQPDTLTETSFREVLFAGNVDMPGGLHTTVSLRPASQLCEQGQGKAWLFLPVKVVENHQNTPFMLAALVADFSNGVGQLSLGNNTGMINADITLQLYRLPVSEWIGLDARTLVHTNGVAMVQAQMFDTQGMVGQVMQSVIPTPEFNR